MGGGSRRTPPPQNSSQPPPKLPSVSELLSSTSPGGSPPYGQHTSAHGYAETRSGSYSSDSPPHGYGPPQPHLVHRPFPPLGAGTQYGPRSNLPYRDSSSLPYGSDERASLPSITSPAPTDPGQSASLPPLAPVHTDMRPTYPLDHVNSPHPASQSEPSLSSQSTERAKMVARPVRKLVGEQIVPGEGLCYVYDDGSYVQKEIDGEPVNASWGVTKAGKPRKRLAIACKTCRDKKIKCEPAEPKCVQCDKSGSECHFETARVPRR